MPINAVENGPAAPLGEPPDIQPRTLADACEEFLGWVRKACRDQDGLRPDEMQLIATTFKGVQMEMRAAVQRQSAAGPQGVPGEMQPQGGPPSETQDYGSAEGAEPMEQ